MCAIFSESRHLQKSDFNTLGNVIDNRFVHHGLEANRMINIIVATLQLSFSSVFISHPNQIPKPFEITLETMRTSLMSVDII